MYDPVNQFPQSSAREETKDVVVSEDDNKNNAQNKKKLFYVFNQVGMTSELTAEE